MIVSIELIQVTTVKYHRIILINYINYRKIMFDLIQMFLIYV